MRLPGLAWLELAVDEGADGGVVFRQRALFAPRGLAGHLYWQAIKPFHGIVFGGMQRGIAAEAERVHAEGTASRWHRSGNLPGTLGGPTA